MPKYDQKPTESIPLKQIFSMRAFREICSSIMNTFLLVALMATSIGSLAYGENRLTEQSQTDAAKLFDQLVQKRWALARFQAQLENAKIKRNTHVTILVASSIFSLASGVKGFKVLLQKGRNYLLIKENPHLQNDSATLYLSIAAANGYIANENRIKLTIDIRLIEDLQKAIQEKQIEVDHAIAAYEATRGF